MPGAASVFFSTKPVETSADIFKADAPDAVFCSLAISLCLVNSDIRFGFLASYFLSLGLVRLRSPADAGFSSSELTERR